MHHTYAEYLALEEESLTRHEFLDGEIYAMAGGTPDHAALAGAVIGVLQGRLPQGCRVFTLDLRIRIPKTGLSTYPDGAVVCGRSARADDDPLAVVNPVLLLEVTSPSTEQYDRGEKLRHYQTLPSLRDLLVVSHHERRITVVSRIGDDRWESVDYRTGQTFTLASLGGVIAVSDVYREEFEDL